MSPEIYKLDDATKDRIAAGEVVERPASVVKELLENAIDANASRISIAVSAGGKEEIVVSDNGVGMSPSNLEMAVQEHTTSKLSSIDDLDSLTSLGFRGEALHAIGSVSTLSIRTKTPQCERGTEISVDNGEITAIQPVGCPVGTTVRVTNLFESVPARREFMKTDTTEFDHIQRIVTGYSLATPDISISLEHNERELFATAGDGNRASAIMEIYGRTVAEAMIPLEHPEVAGPIDTIRGLVSHPETNRSGPEYMTTLVGGRFVTSRLLREAIVDGYGKQLSADRYPFAVVDIDVPPSDIDVNVHPRKLEILFANEDEVYTQVQTVVKETLIENGLLRSRAPRGKSSPAETTTQQEMGPHNQGDIPSMDTRSASPVDASHPCQQHKTDPSTTTKTVQGSAVPKQPGSRSPISTGETVDSVGKTSSTPGEPGHKQSVDTEPSDTSTHHESRIESKSAQQTLSGETAVAHPDSFDNLPGMKVLGQYDSTYIVIEMASGLGLIDQHAADERIHYEELRDRLHGQVTTQTLASPVNVEVTAREAEVAKRGREALASLGFRIQQSDRTLTVTTVPAFVAERVEDAIPQLARDVLEDIVRVDSKNTIDAIADDVIADLACHPSITANTSLTEGNIISLLESLDSCENPYACPHGRPTIIEFSRDEIDTRFERDYPGHQERRNS